MAPRDMEGVRVLECGPFINVAYAGKLLADLGAQVIKIESPDGDDPNRVFGPFPGDIPDPEKSALHLFNNSNKLGVTLRPALPTGRRLFKDLAAWADILIECTEPGFLGGLGLDYPALKDVNPRLIMVTISSLGRSGPYAGYKGCDLISWHGSGTSHSCTGEPDREPLLGAWYQASHWGALNAAAAAAIALHAREKTGRGQWIDVSEAQALAQLLLAVDVSSFNQSGETKVRRGTSTTGTAPTGMYASKDGWVSLMAIAPHQWEGLVKAMGSPEWATSPLFKGTGRDRAPYAEEINALMAGWLESHTALEVFQVCQAYGTPTAPLNTLKTLYEDAHLKARDYFVEMEHPAAGHLRVPGPPFRMSGEDPWRIDRPAPLLGQHNEEVYCGILGIPKSALPDLRRAGVI